MRVKLKLQQHGIHGHAYWWIVAQPTRKKVAGKYLEHLGIWAPHKKSTVTRHVALNKHRVRYWLSVGAEPTGRVQRLLEKFDFVPKAYAPFGSQHQYQKPEKVYGLMAFRGIAKNGGAADQRVEQYYRQRLQDEMNLVERKRRLNKEILAMPDSKVLPASAAADDTDAQDSEEGDIFERKAKFEKLLKKYTAHREKKGLLLKGNDLRSNIYLNKMQKLSRNDLGLDVLGYKDYVHNLKMFAHINEDMQILARESMFNDAKPYEQVIVEMEAEGFKGKEQGLQRALKHADHVSIALAKLMRKNFVNLNVRDEAALEDLCQNIESYVSVSLIILEQLRRFLRLQKITRANEEQWDDLDEQLNHVSLDVLEQAGVSQRQFEQIKMMLKIDKNMLKQDHKRHPFRHVEDNVHQNFVDFTKLPADIPKDAKNLLYRPQKMKVLYEGYRKIVVQLRTNAARKYERQMELDKIKINRIKFEGRVMRKPQNEIDFANKIYDKLQQFMEQARTTQRATQQKFDPKLRVEVMGQEHWGETLFDKLLRERREIPKAERLAKFRNDSVDEVDTTDLENWVLLRDPDRKRPEIDWRAAQRDKDTETWVEDELAKTSASEGLTDFEDSGKYELWLDPEHEDDSESEHPFATDDEILEVQDELFIRHRLDMARLYLGKDGGYSLRKFKRIFKREMEERPENYIVLTAKDKIPPLDEKQLNELFENEEVTVDVVAASTDSSYEEEEEDENGEVIEKIEKAPSGGESGLSGVSGLSGSDNDLEIDAEIDGEIDVEIGEDVIEKPHDASKAEEDAEVSGPEDLAGQSSESEVEEPKKKKQWGKPESSDDEPNDELIEEEKAEWRAQFTKEIAEMNADSEDDTVTLDEDELEALLTRIETETFITNEQAEKFFEEYVQKITRARLGLNKKRGKSIKKEDPYMKIMRPPTVQSQVNGEWILDAKNTVQHFKDLTSKIGRYPEGFRHYESYVNYKFIEQDATVEEYMQVMNAQCEFDDFLRIVREAAIQEVESPMWQNKHIEGQNSRFDGITHMELIESVLFEQEARVQYEAKVQAALLRGEWFKLVDALDDTVDMWHYGRNMFNWPTHNTFLPSKYTIMPKPNLLDKKFDDMSFQFGRTTYDRLQINPTQQFNPLKAYKMAPGLDRKDDPFFNDGMDKGWKITKNRHTSKPLRNAPGKRRFSTLCTPLDTVQTVRKYFNF